MTIRLLTLGIAALCLVPLAARWDANARDERKKIRRCNPTEVHNFQVRAWKHWTIAFWSDGKLFNPGEPIGVQLRFNTDNDNFDGKKLVATFTVIDTKSKESVGSAKVNLSLLKIDSELSAYGVSIENITPNPNDARRSAIYPPGRYNIHCEIQLDDSKIATFEEMWISLEERGRPAAKK